jgi:hypothetical protein
MVKYSCGLAIVVFKHASQSLSAAYTAWHGLMGGRKQDYVAFALMISLGVVLAQCTMQ